MFPLHNLFFGATVPTFFRSSFTIPFLYFSPEVVINRSRKMLSRNYSSGRLCNFSHWQRLCNSIGNSHSKTLHPGKIYASINFIEPYHLIIDCELLTYGFITLLEQYAFNLKSEKYLKFTMGYIMILPNKSEVVTNLGKAIPLYDISGNPISKKAIYFSVERLVRLYAERYQDALIKGIFINIYIQCDKSENVESYLNPIPKISNDMFSYINKVMDSDMPDVPPKFEAKSLKYREGRISNKISALKASYKDKCRPFIVADIETLLLSDIHVPYAAGYLVVNPDIDLTAIKDHSIKTFYSEDHLLVYPKFEDRSERMLEDFLLNLERLVRSHRECRTVYFHNFGHFDGIFILQYYASRKSDKYKIKTLVRNHNIYELKVYVRDKFLLRFRDSCTLLPSSLEVLGNTLCPELGGKGSLPHSKICVDSLNDYSKDIIKYLRQDILVLGGVMKRAQQIYWERYGVDVEDVMTITSLSMKIFRKKYLDDRKFHIGIPNRNQDTFIRRGYYGGHVDVYKPYGENLYYYDINSLYPYVMKNYPMPSGVPVWHNNLEDVKLDDLFGFFEAYVVCPSTIEHPFLPYKDKFGTLIFPTGRFIGVYYSEELKYARELGYKIIPLRGYMFQKKASPFEGFISDLYKSRLEAKKSGDQAMSFVYKILMNSLYGRFGINPESIVTEICTQEQLGELLERETFQSAEKLTDNYYIVSYITNSLSIGDDDWKAPKMSAVHIAAAITASARIHMYKHIASPDCYYTDTDSIVLGSPLPDDLVSSTEMGKFKMEYKVNQGFFLAPKCYYLRCEDGSNIIKHKGPAKEFITSDWFKELYGDPSLTKHISTSANFRIDWKNLRICKKDINLKLGLPKNTKRDDVYDENDNWVGTRPKNVIDVGSQDATLILKYELLHNKKDEGSE